MLRGKPFDFHWSLWTVPSSKGVMQHHNLAKVATAARLSKQEDSWKPTPRNLAQDFTQQCLNILVCCRIIH